MLKEILIFLDWVKVKIGLGSRRSKTIFKEGEIWWCSIGRNIGVEIYGKGKKFTRPVLVLKKFGVDSFFGIPLTSNRKEGSWYVPVKCAGIPGSGILNQGRLFDRKRLRGKIETITGENLSMIRKAFVDLYSY